jgi:hypothetical protein
VKEREKDLTDGTSAWVLVKDISITEDYQSSLKDGLFMRTKFQHDKGFVRFYRTTSLFQFSAYPIWIRIESQ